MAQAQPLVPQLDRTALISAEKTRYARRQLTNTIASGLMFFLTAVSVSVLFIILAYIFINGISTLFPVVDGHLTFNLDFFIKPPESNLDGTTGGGVAQAILGTIEILIVAGIIAVPLGVGAAIYLSEYGTGFLVNTLNFTIDLLAGLPSVVVGLFVLAAFIGNLALIKIFPHFAGLAGSFALIIVMVPIIARSVEQILRLVPDSLREAGLALGMPKWRVILQIVLPTVAGGITTGIMLSLARAAGETAPVLLTILGQQFISTDLLQPMDALPIRIYKYATTGQPDLIPKAWAGTMVLVIVIALFSIAVRYVTGRNRYDA